MQITVKDRSVNWKDWRPEIRATLMFIVQEEQVLLIEKLTGIGKGKINGPGGKIDPGETPEQAIIRECQEELLITPHAPRKRGELWFAMSDIPDIHCHVFMADSFEGTPTATREANPFWQDIKSIPYEKMWADDRYWLPQMLAGSAFNGRFIFKEETILWDEVFFDEQGKVAWKQQS